MSNFRWKMEQNLQEIEEKRERNTKAHQPFTSLVYVRRVNMHAII